jgi:hypothetical protein
MEFSFEKIVEQRGHWRKLIEMDDDADDLIFHECVLCGFTITSSPRDCPGPDSVNRVLREIDDHDHSTHPDQFEPMSFTEFVDAIRLRAMEINDYFGLDAFTWPDRCWGEITHAGRKSLREQGGVSQ